MSIPSFPARRSAPAGEFAPLALGRILLYQYIGREVWPKDTRTPLSYTGRCPAEGASRRGRRSSARADLPWVDQPATGGTPLRPRPPLTFLEPHADLRLEQLAGQLAVERTVDASQSPCVSSPQTTAHAYPIARLNVLATVPETTPPTTVPAPGMNFRSPATAFRPTAETATVAAVAAIVAVSILTP